MSEENPSPDRTSVVRRLQDSSKYIEDSLDDIRHPAIQHFWGRNLIRDPPCAAELSERFEDFEQSFLDGQPFEFAEVAYNMFAS